MNRRDLVEITELLERIQLLLEEHLHAATPEKRTMLEADINAAKEKLQKFATSFKN